MQEYKQLCFNHCSIEIPEQEQQEQKQKYIVLILSTILLCASSYSSVYCENLATKDFAYGFILNVSGDSPIYRMELPEAVYQGVLRQDLGDIRIFNGSGEILPHLIRSSVVSNPDTYLNNNHTNIPFFPRYNEYDTKSNNNLSLKIVQSSDGTIIRVDSASRPGGSTKTKDGIQDNAENSTVTQNTASQNTTTNITGYLLDMGKTRPYPVAIELEWSGGSDHFVLDVILDGSNDLTYWDYLTEKALAKLQFGGNSVYQNQLSIEEGSIQKTRQYRYLRLSWPAGEQDSTSGAALSRITAIFPGTEIKTKREWREISGSFSQTNRMVINFDSGGYFPVDAVQIKFHQTNSIIRATIDSSSDHSIVKDHSVVEHERYWNQRCEGVFYTLRAVGSNKKDDSGHTGSSELSNGIFTFSTTSDRFWRIEVSQDGAGLAGAVYPPVLKVGWRPHEILFVARGNPPYTLAYGSSKLLKNNSGLQGIPDMVLGAANREGEKVNNDDSDTAADNTNANKPIVLNITHGTPTILGGDNALKLPPPPLPWKTWILWGVLILGVCLLAFMVWRLTNQMR